MKKINYASMFTLRPDGRYQGYWHDLIDGEPKGKRHTICDKDPENLYFKIQEKERPTKITFKVLANMWKDSEWGKYRDGTIDMYKAPFDRAIDRFGDVAACELQSSDIYAHLLEMRKKDYSKRAISAQRTIYNKCYEFALADKKLNEQIRYNPAHGVKFPDGIKKAVQREAPEEEIVEQIKAKADTAYFGNFALFLILTGLRRGEALALQWKDIDFEKKEITCSKGLSYHGVHKVGEPKTEAAYRTLPLLPPAEKMLLPIKGKPNEFVFHGEDKNKFLPQPTYVKHWKHYCKDMGFIVDEPTITKAKNGREYVKHHYKNTLTAHVMRHGYATTLFECEVDEFTAQRLMGHADIAITHAVYTHLREKQREKNVQKLLDKFAE